jgi:signal transduction histidine kinase
MHELNAKDCPYQNKSTDCNRYTKIMKQNCCRLLRLANNLIDITKIDAGYFEIDETNNDIISLVENITLSVADYIEGKGLSLIFDTDVEEKVTACDPEKIERIILNLLSNAVKFTPDGGSIDVRIYDNGNSLSIKVSDNGIGIPEDKQREIFQRFCQVSDILSRQHEGSGIGLNIVKSLVEMHGGAISVESEYGKGTTFTVNLPVRKVEEDYKYKEILKQDNVDRIIIEFSDVYAACQDN